MNETTQATENTEATSAPAEKKLANIVRGVMPVALVHTIRFHYKDGKEAEVAKKFGTTTGKVADIRKNRNFAYITEEFLPTQEQKDAAIVWLKQVPDYDAVGTDEVVNLVETQGVATAEQSAAFLAKRSSMRAKTVKTPASPTAEGAEAVAEAANAKAAKKSNKGNKSPEPAAASSGDVASLLS